MEEERGVRERKIKEEERIQREIEEKEEREKREQEEREAEAQRAAQSLLRDLTEEENELFTTRCTVLVQEWKSLLSVILTLFRGAQCRL